MSLFTETVIIEHPGGETGEYDSLGLPVVSPAQEEVVSAWYEPRSSSEDVAAKDQQIDGYWVYMPRAVELEDGTQRLIKLEPQARIFIEDEWYEVDGKPGRMPGGFEIEGYLAAAVRQVSG